MFFSFFFLVSYKELYYTFLMWQVVKKQNIFFLWAFWHYNTALREIFRGWKDVFRFNIYYFSLPFLLKTFFSPWRRYKFSYGRGFNFNKFIETFFLNVFSRFVGLFIRFFVILAGVILQIFIIIFGISLFIFWIVLPIATLFGIYISLKWLILI